FTFTNPPVGGTGTITGTLSTMPAGASATFTVVVHVLPSTPGGTNITNTASVSSPTDSTSPHSATVVTPVVASAITAITMTGSPGPGIAVTNITYTIPFTNNGPSYAQSVQLTAAVPANTTFVSEAQTSGPTFTFTNPPVGGTGTITGTISTLAAGASA